MFVWLNRAMINFCHRFCYIKDIRIYIVIQIVTRLQKNMVAPKNLAPSENLPPPAALSTHTH